jgi:hypothetical protein
MRRGMKMLAVIATEIGIGRNAGAIVIGTEIVRNAGVIATVLTATGIVHPD